jgi:RNA polymerase I-specific transcription initiation factor RRN3
MVVKLDSILEVVFKHLERTHLGVTAPPPLSLASDPSSRPSTPTPAIVPSTPVPSLSPALLQIQQETRFTSLLSIFTRTILRTFKSRYTQFLLFWYTSLSLSFRDRFLGTVISHALLEHDLPVVTRAAAASYVASYVSRAVFVDRKETQAVVGVICEFLEAHLDVFDRIAGLGSASTESQSTEQHVMFYAAAQAVFLIFCFRWRDLMEGEGDEEEEAAGNFDGFEANTSGLQGGLTAGKSWIPQLSVLQRVIHSPLNPLKVRLIELVPEPSAYLTSVYYIGMLEQRCAAIRPCGTEGRLPLLFLNP